MKVLLIGTMALGVVFMLGANPPAEATVIQPTFTSVQQDHLIPVWHRWHGHRWHHRHWPRFYRWGW